MMAGFKSRAQAKHRVVESPNDIAALISSYWPPYSREDLVKTPDALRRVVALGTSIGQMPTSVMSPKFLIWRLQEAVKLIQEQAVRYATNDTWSLTSPNGRVIKFPLTSPSARAFKAMADEYTPYYEKSLVDYLVERLTPNDVFVDVGANVGYVSAFAATTGAAVYAVEIQRVLIPLIEQLATINEFDLLRPLHLGLSNGSGLSMMWRTGINFGAGLEGQTNRFIMDEPRSVADDFVPMMALDDAFASEPMRPTIVKVDVEGHEIDVINGARRTIEQRQTTFIVEFHAHLISMYDRTPDELAAPFSGPGWSWSQLTDDGLRPIASMADVIPDPRDPNPKLVFEPAG